MAYTEDTTFDPLARPDNKYLHDMLDTMSTGEIAAMYDVSRTTVCSWISEGLGDNIAQEQWKKRRKRMRDDREKTRRITRAATTSRSRSREQFSDKDITDAILAVADGSATLTSTRYQAERKPTMPSIPLIMKRFGTWNDAIELAGLDVVDRRGRRSGVSDSTAVATAVAYMQHCYKHSERATFRGIKEFAKERNIPSTEIVRMRWSDLLAEARDRWETFTSEPKFWTEEDIHPDGDYSVE